MRSWENSETVCQDKPEPEPHPAIFDGIDGVLIRSTMLNKQTQQDLQV